MLNWTNIPEVISSGLVNLVSRLDVPAFILVVVMFFAIIIMSIFIPGTTEKWTLISPIMVPLFMKASTSPDYAQMVFKAADSIGKCITPLFVYFIILLAFLEKYNTNDLPLWALSEILSFGTLTKLYTILPIALKKEIASSFNENLDIKVFDNWLLELTVVRNTCAHHARMWNRKFTISFKYPKQITNFLDNSVSTNQIFFALSVMLVLLKDNKLKDELASLFKKYPNVDKRKMGFTDNWQEFTIWKEQ